MLAALGWSSSAAFAQVGNVAVAESPLFPLDFNDISATAGVGNVGLQDSPSFSLDFNNISATTGVGNVSVLDSSVFTLDFNIVSATPGVGNVSVMDSGGFVFDSRDFVWDGSVGNWTDSSHWIPNGVPGPNNGATVTNGFVTASTDASVYSLQLNGGTIGGTGTLTVYSQMNWLGGTMQDAGITRIATNALLTINNTNAGSTRGLAAQRTLEIQGAAFWTQNNFIPSDLALSDGSSIVVRSNGVFAINSENAITAQGSPTPRFVNEGTLLKTNDLGDTTFQCLVTNAGVIDLQAGRLVCQGGFAPGHNSTFRLAIDNFFGVGERTGIVAGGNLNLDGALQVVLNNQAVPTLGTSYLVVSNQNFSGSFSSFSENILNNGFTMALDYPGNGARLTTVTLSLFPASMGKILADSTPPPLTAQYGVPPYTFALTAGSLPPGLGLLPNGTFTGTATNLGNYNFTAMVTDANGHAASRAYSVQVANYTGTSYVWIGGSGYWESAAQWSPNGVPGTNDEAIVSSGLVTMLGKRQVSSLIVNGGTLSGGYDVTVGNNMTWSGGVVIGARSYTILPGARMNITGGGTHDMSSCLFTNNGTVNWAGGTITDGSYGNIYNNGLWDAQGDGVLSYGGSLPTPTFYNAGIFRKSAGTGTTTFNGGFGFINSGTNDVQSGTVSIAGNGTNNAPGIFNTTNGTALLFNNTYTFNAGSQFTGTGDMRLSSGTFTLNGSINFSKLTQTGGSLAGANVLNGAFTFGGGTWGGLGGATTIASGSTLNITSNISMDSKTLTNNGTVVWKSGTISEGNNGNIYNNGLWDAQGDNVFQFSGSLPNPTFYNAGTLRKSAGAGTTTINASTTFINTGTNDVQSGTVSINGTHNLTNGTISIGISSLSNYGKVSLSGAAALAGRFKAALNGSYIPAAGNAFPLVTYGTLSGGFGSFNLPANNTWQTNYGSTTFTLTALGATNYPPVVLQTLRISGNTFQLGIPTVNNLNYTVQFNRDLGTTNWLPYTNITGDGSTWQFVIPLTNAQGFFRVSQP